LHKCVDSLTHVQNAPWVFVIWGMSTVFMHIVGRVFLLNSSFSVHSVVLGYSVCVLIPVCVIAMMLKQMHYLADSIKLFGIMWATTSAFITYLHICFVSPDAKESRRYLLILPILLMHVYLVSLMPRL
jgi:hypothetical protein